MAFYIIGGIAVLLLLLFLKGLKKTTDLSTDATELVAYIKYAGKGKSAIFDKDKSDEEFYESKYKMMMKACVLMNRFYLKVKDLPPTYRFHIKENGDMYGEIFEVQVGPLMYKLTETLTKITESFPVKYQEKIDNYMKNPLSAEGKRIEKDILNEMFPKDSFLKKYAGKLHQSIVNTDFMYILCK